MAHDVVREAMVGYRQLVELNFPAFGDAMGLFSMLPVRVEGLVLRAENNEDPRVGLMLALHPDTGKVDDVASQVDLSVVVKDHAAEGWKFAERQRSMISIHLSRAHQRFSRSAFGQNRMQVLDLPLHVPCLASSLAYGWLTQDLIAVRWLDADFRFSE
ncbi:hypothetical protein CFP71_14655 [Amycolatopsis thailandensis]|uniref:Uncharacterized protein n=1 Tax=Amycolatopsis thailandensis TaxID=589330 RepID=A0A229SAW6_9PSEU|nr:hypothetical protein [Amycolatopsis thailandensis]OXM56073.1 hypothetical protein CFP71_14655 [Amycolatopsis thailandensis]